MIDQRMRPFRHKNRRFWFKGGGGGDSYDSAYNARMATIAEKQSSWSDMYNQFWIDYEQPFEQAKLASNQQMLPGETALSIAQTQAQTGLIPQQAALESAQISSAMGLLPQQTALSKAQMTSAMDLLPYETEAAKESAIYSKTKDKIKAPVMQKYFQEASEGVDAEAWANEAQADAAQAFLSSSSGAKMVLARRGAAPGSGAYTGQSNESAMSRTMMTGSARASGREAGEKESFNRLQSAMGV